MTSHFSTDSTDMCRTPKSNMQLDQVKLQDYLIGKLEGVNNLDEIQILQFMYGQSNPTYQIIFNESKFVLRKSPPGTLLHSAHQVIREANIFIFLHQQGIPVPKIYLICEDVTILGTPFYIMEFIDGIIYRDPTLPLLNKQEKVLAYAAFTKTLAQIHSIDISKFPNNISHKSSICNNYSRRQIKMWTSQYQQSSSAVNLQLEGMDSLQTWLVKNIPPDDDNGENSDFGTRLTHGDYRFDNIIFDKHNHSKILAVLDWELSSLGNPLADVAYACLIYHLPAVGMLSGLTLLRDDTTESSTSVSLSSQGIPNEEEFIQAYLSQVKLKSLNYFTPISSNNWNFYLTLSIFRSIAILTGVHARAIQGNASQGQVAQATRQLLPVLINVALKLTNIDSITRKIITKKSAPNVLEKDQLIRGPYPSQLVEDLISKIKQFIKVDIQPVELSLLEHYATSEGKWPIRGNKWLVHPLLAALTSKARSLGLWNLWMSQELEHQLRAAHPHWDWETILPHGRGLSNIEYSYIAIESGKVLWLPELMNCAAPDTGNMETIARYGTESQREVWLRPLLLGEIRSCFAMTEPEVSSSDPTQLATSAVLQGAGGEGGTSGTWLINGRKWWTTGACDPRCECCILVARTESTDTDTPPHQRHSLLVFPLSTKGVTVVRPLTVFGYDDAPHGHAETTFDNVVVGSDALLGVRGRGFPQAQIRLGPGRLHHCCRLLGHAERAMAEVVQRGSSRQAFGKSLLQLGGNAEKLALARIALQQATLLVLDAASKLDEIVALVSLGKLNEGVLSKDAMLALALAKVATPQATQACLDFAIQLHGGGGLSAEHPLSCMWAATRTLRIVDGPDEVHLRTIAKLEIDKLLKARTNITADRLHRSHRVHSKL